MSIKSFLAIEITINFTEGKNHTSKVVKDNLKWQR